MKSKELIELLQKEDPNGVCDVCIDNKDIAKIFYEEPGYYDGRFQKVTKWDKNSPLETTIMSSGSKINLRIIDLWDHYVDVFLYEDKDEYVIKIENDQFGHDWVRWAHWRLDKLFWVINYVTGSNHYDKNRDSIIARCEEAKLAILKESEQRFNEYVDNSVKNNHMPKACGDAVKETANTIRQKLKIAIFDAPAHGNDYVVFNLSSMYQPKFNVTHDGRASVITENWEPDPEHKGRRRRLEDTVTSIDEYDWEALSIKNIERLGRDE